MLANLVGAVFAGLSFVLQRYEARDVVVDGARILAALVRRPIWWAGFGSQMAAAALTFVAFSLAPIEVVQPFAAASLPFMVFFAWLILDERPGRYEITTIAVIALGIVLAAATVGGDRDLTEISTTSFVVTIAAIAAGIAACTIGFRVTRRPKAAGAFAGIAAGTAMGVATATFRIVGVALAPKAGDWVPPLALVVAALVILVGFGLYGLVVMQLGLRGHTATSIVPAQTVTVLSMPVIISVFGYGQELPGGAAIQSLRFVAFALIVGGVVALAMSPQVQTDVLGGTIDGTEIAPSTPARE